MKRIWLSIVCGMLLAGAGLLAGGCEDNQNWQFENNSSFRVYVAPNGQDWPAAYIEPGQTIEVDYNEDTIQYIYTPSGRVRDEEGSDRTIHFYNR